MNIQPPQEYQQQDQPVGSTVEEVDVSSVLPSAPQNKDFEEANLLRDPGLLRDFELLINKRFEGGEFYPGEPLDNIRERMQQVESEPAFGAFLDLIQGENERTVEFRQRRQGRYEVNFTRDGQPGPVVRISRQPGEKRLLGSSRKENMTIDVYLGGRPLRIRVEVQERQEKHQDGTVHNIPYYTPQMIALLNHDEKEGWKNDLENFSDDARLDRFLTSEFASAVADRLRTVSGFLYEVSPKRLKGRKDLIKRVRNRALKVVKG